MAASRSLIGRSLRVLFPRYQLATPQLPHTLTSRSLIQARKFTSYQANHQARLLPEFSLKGKVICVSGGAQGLGLVQSEGLLEAGAIGMTTSTVFWRTYEWIGRACVLCTKPTLIVHALDLKAQPSPDFDRVAQKAADLGSSLTYHQVDVRDIPALDSTVSKIADKHNGIHGLIAAGTSLQILPL